MIAAIVFDFDGVIADSEPLHYEAFVAVARRFGLEFDYATYQRRYIGFDDRDAFRAMLETIGDPVADDARIAELTHEKAHTFEAHVHAGIDALPGAIELVRAASTAMPVAIASGATRRDIDLILDKLGLRDCFELIVSADDVARSKPDPETYRLAVQHLADRHADRDIKAGACVAIEDTEAGLASARAAGLRTVGIDPSGEPGGLIGADQTLQSLTDLSLDRLHRWWP